MAPSQKNPDGRSVQCPDPSNLLWCVCMCMCRSAAGVDVVPTFTTSNARMCLLLSNGRFGLLRIEDAERLQVGGWGRIQLTVKVCRFSTLLVCGLAGIYHLQVPAIACALLHLHCRTPTHPHSLPYPQQQGRPVRTHSPTFGFQTDFPTD